MNEQCGSLYLVATPIGNLSDFSARGAEILAQVGLVACEDTRKSKILFDRYSIRPEKVTSYHSHNAESKKRQIITTLKSGIDVAIISDAGTPGINDPGVLIIGSAIQEGIDVVPVPGSSALLAGLTGSGFPSHRFIFEGFLPRKKGRKTLFESWIKESRTIIFYESPMRILKSLRDIAKIIGEREACVARELTKIYEEFIRGDIKDVIKQIEDRTVIKGEIVVLLAPANFRRE